jgi:hypothetical protein
MSTANAPGSQANLPQSITEVGMLTYISLILMDTGLRNVVVTQLAAMKAAGGSAPATLTATANVTAAMAAWGFPQSTIDQVSKGNLATEDNLFNAVPNALPDSYGMSGCTAVSVKPALSLLSK